MNDTSSSGNGVNGIRVAHGQRSKTATLYYNNPSQNILARIPIDSKTGARRGNPEVIASDLSPDDFEIDERKGFAYITDPDNSRLLKLSLKNGSKKTVVEGLAGPTTARWKDPKGKRALYVATTGGYEQWLNGNPTEPAKIYEVDV